MKSSLFTKSKTLRVFYVLHEIIKYGRNIVELAALHVQQ
jgi:hypothetical protein